MNRSQFCSLRTTFRRVDCPCRCTCVAAESRPAQSALAGPFDRVTQTPILTAACVSALQAIAPPWTRWRNSQRISGQDKNCRLLCLSLITHTHTHTHTHTSTRAQDCTNHIHVYLSNSSLRRWQSSLIWH